VHRLADFAFVSGKVEGRAIEQEGGYRKVILRLRLWKELLICTTMFVSF
jgi:hypothetical protein